MKPFTQMKWEWQFNQNNSIHVNHFIEFPTHDRKINSRKVHELI